METVEYIELFWDCPECGQKHISAVFNPQGNRCPRCLYWRVETVELYEAPDSQIVTDRDLIDRKPFWVCKVCNAVNEDTGLSANLLQCGNCDSYQVSEVGNITGNEASDKLAPNSVAVGETVEFRENSPEDDSNNSVPSDNRDRNKRLKWLAAGLTGVTLIGGGFVGSSLLSPQTNDPTVLQVQVTDRQWTSEVKVQEQKTLNGQSWRDEMPSGASIIKSETRQRGTRQEQRGVKTVMVEERYQSGIRSETYYESERYQSGTRSETYYESERYQSGTRSETYYESERYQSGTRSETYYESERYQSSSKQECKTTSRGNGIGQRSCKSVPVYSTRKVPRTRSIPIYSTRKVPRTRSVPIYSTRKVPRTRSVPIYSTRKVPRTRSIPVYSTRKVPVQEPILVSVPVKDMWVTYRANEWIIKQTHTRTGRNNLPTNTAIKLSQNPPQRISDTRMTCRIQGTFTFQNSWFEKPQSKTGSWELPCQEYQQIKTGERVTLRQNTINSANLMPSSPR